MLAEYFDLVVYILKNLLLMLRDEAIESFLGVSVIGCIVTAMCIIIVIRALINPVGLGSGIIGFENAVTYKSDRDYRSAVRDARVHNNSISGGDKHG